MVDVFPQPGFMQKIVEEFDLRNSAAIAIDEVIVTSGLGAFDVETGMTLSGDDVTEHANHAIDTYDRVLREIGLSLDHVVKVNAYLRYPEKDYPAWNLVFQSRFRSPYPCRTTVGAPLVAGIIELDFTLSRSPRLGDGVSRE